MRVYSKRILGTPPLEQSEIKLAKFSLANAGCIGWALKHILQFGEDVKTVQELLRHANSKITLDVYTQGGGFQ